MPTDHYSLRIIVMGVSGSGKSTLAEGLSKALSLPMKDGDELHLPESVAKMSAGIALEDADRWPWLDRIASYLAGTDANQYRSQGEANPTPPKGRFRRHRLLFSTQENLPRPT
jgi:cytidylate kinase